MVRNVDTICLHDSYRMRIQFVRFHTGTEYFRPIARKAPQVTSAI